MAYYMLTENMDAKERRQFDASLIGRKVSTGSAELRSLMSGQIGR